MQLGIPATPIHVVGKATSGSAGLEQFGEPRSGGGKNHREYRCRRNNHIESFHSA